MAFSGYHFYLVRVTYPSGDLMSIVKTLTFPKADWEVQKLHAEIARGHGQNDDVIVDYASVKYIGAEGDPAIEAKMEAAKAEMRKTLVEPDSGEGIDTLNRLLADPKFAQDRAAAKQASAPAVPTEV